MNTRSTQIVIDLVKLIANRSQSSQHQVTRPIAANLTTANPEVILPQSISPKRQICKHPPTGICQPQ